MRIDVGSIRVFTGKLVMRRILLPLVLILAVTGCSQEETTSTTPKTTAVTQTETAGRAEKETTEPKPTIDTSPTATGRKANPTTVVEPKPGEPTPTIIETRAEGISDSNQGDTQGDAVVFNGVYGDTYFRGAETAPVTIIDYSDFL